MKYVRTSSAVSYVRNRLSEDNTNLENVGTTKVEKKVSRSFHLAFHHITLTIGFRQNVYPHRVYAYWTMSGFNHYNCGKMNLVKNKCWLLTSTQPTLAPLARSPHILYQNARGRRSSDSLPVE